MSDSLILRFEGAFQPGLAAAVPPFTRASAAAYIEHRAAKHDAAAQNSSDDSYHRGTATLFRALASDILAGIDQS